MEKTALMNLKWDAGWNLRDEGAKPQRRKMRKEREP